MRRYYYNAGFGLGLRVNPRLILWYTKKRGNERRHNTGGGGGRGRGEQRKRGTRGTPSREKEEGG